MKKVVFFATRLVIVLVIGCTIFACRSTGGFYSQDLGTYNKYYAEEQTCILEFVSVLKINVFDGKPVDWVNPWLYGDEAIRATLGKSYVRIPAGRHELYASYSYKSTGGYSTVRYNAEDLKITYNFIAGRTYRLDAILSTSRGEVVNDPTNYLTGSTNNAFTIRLEITETTSTTPEIKGALGLVNDRRLDGTWQFAKDPRYKLVFYGDTWRLLEDDKIAWEGGGRPLSGVFFLIQDEIHCVIIERQGLPFKYRLAGNTLTINSMQFLTWMTGQWNKIDSGREFLESNPLVGTWKTVADNGSVNIFYFDSTGAAWEYIYNEPGYLNRHNYYDYQYDNSTNTGILGTNGIIINFGNNTDELKIRNVTYKRE